MRFLADESCDFAVVRALRDHGHDVTAVVEIHPGADDKTVLALAASERRVLLTEDKDFGSLAYAEALESGGVILIRFPGRNRAALGSAIPQVVATIGPRLVGAFVVVEPGRARFSRPVAEGRKSTDK